MPGLYFPGLLDALAGWYRVEKTDVDSGLCDKVQGWSLLDGGVAALLLSSEASSLFVSTRLLRFLLVRTVRPPFVRGPMFGQDPRCSLVNPWVFL